MVDVQGDVLRPPHGTTPAAVKSNKNQKVYLNKMSYLVYYANHHPLVVWGH